MRTVLLTALVAASLAGCVKYSTSTRTASTQTTDGTPVAAAQSHCSSVSTSLDTTPVCK